MSNELNATAIKIRKIWEELQEKYEISSKDADKMDKALEKND